MCMILYSCGVILIQYIYNMIHFQALLIYLPARSHYAATSRSSRTRFAGRIPEAELSQFPDVECGVV
jgi:hypothetical protein